MVRVLQHLSDQGVEVERSGQYCGLGDKVGRVEDRPGLLLGNLPLELTRGWPQTPGLPRDSRTQLPLGTRTNLGMCSLASGGQVGYVSFSLPVVELVDLDIQTPPGLHVITNFSDSVTEPKFKDLLVALHGRDSELGVAKERDPGPDGSDGSSQQ